MVDELIFPIMRGKYIKGIPWGMIAPKEVQAKRNHSMQNLKELAKRGGLSPCEAVAVLEGRSWRHDPKAEWELIRRLANANPSPEEK